MKAIVKSTGLIALLLALGVSATASATTKTTHTDTVTPKSASHSQLPFGAVDRNASRPTRLQQEAFTYGKSLGKEGLGSSDPNGWVKYVSPGLRAYAAGGFQAGQAIKAGYR